MYKFNIKICMDSKAALSSKGMSHVFSHVALKRKETARIIDNCWL